jgi:hypothetical protein
VRGGYRNRQWNEESVRGDWARLAPATDRRLGSFLPLALYRPELLAAEIERHAAWASGAPLMDGITAWLQVWQLPFWAIGMTIGGVSIRIDATTRFVLYCRRTSARSGSASRRSHSG